jgi:hypothetical protein
MQPPDIHRMDWVSAWDAVLMRLPSRGARTANATTDRCLKAQLACVVTILDEYVFATL